MISLVEQEPNRRQLAAAVNYLNQFENTTLALIALTAAIRNDVGDDSGADLLGRFILGQYGPHEENQI